MLLKLPNRQMLGRKARCGKCGQKFMLQESTSQPVVQVPAAPVLPSASHRPAPTRAPNQKSEAPAAAGGPANWEADVKTPSVFPSGAGRPSAAIENFSATDPFASGSPLELSEVGSHDSDDAGLARVRALRKQAARRQLMYLSGGIALLLIASGVYFTNATQVGKSTKGSRKGKSSTTAPVSTGNLAADASARSHSGSPTKGKPITTQLVPMGASLLINLRPAVLWEPGGTPEEFKACLGPMGLWLEAMIKKECLLEPKQIEEALFAFIPTGRDSFAVSVVVHTKDDMKKSQLVEKFDGELDDSLGRPYYVGDEKAFVILDQRTFAIAPKGMASELVEAADNPSITTDGVQALLGRTDRERHVTIVFQMEDVRNSVKTLVSESAQQLLNSTLDWFGDEIETATWSIHLPRDYGEGLFSEIVVRNKMSRSPPNLQRDLEKKLAETPGRLRDLAYLINPESMKLGEAKVVGRFPVMTKMVAASTHLSHGNRYVSLQTELPERAAPNLALGALLTWNQTNMPGFGRPSSAGSPPAPKADSKLPETIAERLNKVISVDFRRQFLYAALDEIGDETGVKFKLEGNDLKMVGITQNMYQSFKLENVPATAVLHRIAESLEHKVCVVVDEKNKLAIFTSKQAADEKKLTPFPLAPAGK